MSARFNGQTSSPYSNTGKHLELNVSLYKVRIFSVSENGKNGLGDEGADGGNAPCQNFWT